MISCTGILELAATSRMFRSLALAVTLLSGTALASNESDVRLDLRRYQRDSGIDVAQSDTRIHVTWSISAERRCRFTLETAAEQPLIHSVEVADGDQPFRAVASEIDPVLLVRIGQRDLEKRRGWTIFFDRMQQKQSRLYEATIRPRTMTARSHNRRLMLTIDGVTAGPFQGDLRWTFYADNGFILQEACLKTDENRVAYLYDTVLIFKGKRPDTIAWRKAGGTLQQISADTVRDVRTPAVQGRSIAAGFDGASIALFPTPHRYFYPLDFSNNFKNIWTGPRYQGRELPFGIGIRHDPKGDNRFVPWFNAPPGTTQEMGLFLLVAAERPDDALKQIDRLTRNDRFARLPGHSVFSSHYHVEHTRELLEAQKGNLSDAKTGQLPSGDTYRIPPRLANPGFARVFRKQGIDVVHLAEFHFGRTPRMNRAERIQHLELLHAECRRLSNDKLLLLPGEEPNVHLGGHWISFFPKPVYWVLNRPAGTPFVTDDPRLGRVYHVGGEADVLRLLKAENGLAWTAHPRIKGSTGYPDRYRHRLFFQSERFLGAAWKAMPADLSQPRLGSRVLDLFDDMSNWGEPKYVLGEVDVFKIEPDHELYAHMNVNYLRLDEVPAFEDGWQPVLDTLRGGKFFVTTGEVLIPEFRVNGSRSGESAQVGQGSSVEVEWNLKWTFPLAYAEIITGDGQGTRRHRIDLTDTPSFGERTWKTKLDVAGQHWLRIEVWDIATNGAFTQPVWLR